MTRTVHDLRRAIAKPKQRRTYNRLKAAAQLVTELEDVRQALADMGTFCQTWDAADRRRWYELQDRETRLENDILQIRLAP